MSQEGESITGSKRMHQTDAERALAKIRPSVEDFNGRFTRLVNGGKKDLWRLKFEIHGEGSRVTDIDLNEFLKRRPHEEPN